MSQQEHFYDQYAEKVEQASQLAHMIAVRVLHSPLEQYVDNSGDQLIDPALLLDYAASMRSLLEFLADSGYTQPGAAFVRTADQGPVAVEVVEGGFRVYRFDRSEVEPAGVSPEDRDRIYDAYRRVIG